MSKEAMKLALEALEHVIYWDNEKPEWEYAHAAITALREALAEQPAQQPAQQEPVAWPCLIAEADFSENTVTLAMQCTDYKVSAGKHWLSNTPPAQRTWVGLTNEEIERACIPLGAAMLSFPEVARAIEAKLRSKNEDRN